MLIFLSLWCLYWFTYVSSIKTLYQISNLNIAGRIAGLGDWNGDRIIDLFVLNDDQNRIDIYFWNAKHSVFIKFTSFQMSNTLLSIQNVIVMDWNSDGIMDLIMMAINLKSKDELLIEWVQGSHSMEEFHRHSLPSSYYPHPLVVDWHGNLSANLLGHSYQNPKVFSIWNAKGSLVELSLGPHYEDCALSHPNSNAWVDINGDCKADLLLTCSNNKKSFISIWTNSFNSSQKFDLPAGSGQITFADINADGTLDLIFPSCVKQECWLNIYYNIQESICLSQNARFCRSRSNLCIADPNYRLESIQIPMKEFGPELSQLKLFDSDFNGLFPMSIKLGDLNRDGFPDLIVIAQISNNVAKGVVLESIPCESCNDSYQRYFVKNKAWANVLNDIPGSCTSIALLDLDEDGTLDMLITSKQADGKHALFSVRNKAYTDSFFLKAMALNGACSECKVPYGVNYHGATFKYTVLDHYGERRAVQAVQLPQSGYLSVDTPYSYFGLGRTNNYLEDLFVGLSTSKNGVKVYHGVVPNSKLFVLPWYDSLFSSTKRWKFELYISPSSVTLVLISVLIFSLFCLLGIIYVLHAYEQKEDEIERRKALHVINFDAF